MSQAHRALLAALALVLLLLVWAFLRPGPAAQVDAAFARVQAAFAAGDARALINALDPDYDLPAHGPDLIQVLGTSDDDGSRGSSTLRRTMLPAQGRSFAMMGLRGVHHDFSYTILGIEVDHDLYRARVAIALVGRGGPLPRALDPARECTFTLRSRGWWWPSASFLDHDAIPLAFLRRPQRTGPLQCAGPRRSDVITSLLAERTCRT